MLDIFLAALAALIVRDVILEVYLTVKSDLIGKRVFKLSGRYRLAESFDISFYDNPDLAGKYAFKINEWDVSTDNFRTDRRRVVYFETRLYSFCGSLFYEYAEIVKANFHVKIGRAHV